MVLILFFYGCSIGKVNENIQLNASAKIAKPILVIEKEPEINLTSIENDEYYNFKVKNYDQNNNITQMDIKYNIEVLTKKQKEISIKLYKDNKEIKVENNKSEEFLLTKSDKQVHEYTIKIKYDKSQVTSIEDIIQDIQIKIHSEQIK